ncbi:MAG: DegT/DnrJ/EryC1/StrS family aminotransferase [Nitrospinae bacterium]|nr:DegT/DnrJ/EryC1/StrS family aminotransferase [Nitrospinota bacterium]
MEFIDLKAQYRLVKDKIDARIQKVLDHGQYIMGPEVAELEEKLAAYTGAKHAITVSSGTDALFIAMMALGVKPGDEVITTPFTFIATAETIALLGAIPVFVDVEPESLNMDPAKIEAAITKKTTAIMPVSLYGQCAQMEAINAIASKHGLPVIEDAAQSFGATRHGIKSSAMSTIGCTSFFPAKPLGCYGDGGACFTNDDGLATKMRQIRNHGQDKRYNHPIIGMNGRMDTLQAAILIAKLAIFPDEVAAREKIGARYTASLKGHVQTPVIMPGNNHVYAQYTIRVKSREQVAERLKADGVPTAVHYPKPLHLQPAFSNLGLGVGSFPLAEKAADEVMSLPMGPYLTQEDQDKVVDAVKKAVTN